MHDCPRTGCDLPTMPAVMDPLDGESSCVVTLFLYSLFPLPVRFPKMRASRIGYGLSGSQDGNEAGGGRS
jgi:hypothetical protein